jgi:GAF domain-containing protein
MNTGNGDLLSAAMSEALEVESTSEGTRIALEGVLAATGADAGRILFLDLRSGHFEQRSQVGHAVHDTVEPVPAAGISQEEVESSPTDILDIAARSGRLAWWERGEQSAPSQWHEQMAAYRVVQPVQRGNTVIALLDVEAGRPFSMESLGEFMELLRQVIVIIYERRFTIRLFHELKRPIVAERTRAEFYDDLAELICLSTGMEFVAVREYDQDADSLWCVAAIGLGVERGSFEELSFSSLDDFPSFRHAIEKETVAEPSISASHLESLRRIPYLKNVRSFVAVPIVVGEKVIGVLSVAARCPYEFSRIELRGFETVANAIGVAMANFKNLHANTRRIRQITEEAAEALSDLLAQAGRHEAKAHIDNAQKSLVLAKQGVVGKGKEVDPVAQIERVSDHLARTRDSLDKMKSDALIRPNQSPQRIDIREAVLPAIDQVSGELDDSEISVLPPKSGTFVQVIPEAMILVFLHLFRNSIFAFQKAKKSNRQIEITVAARQAGSDIVKVNVADNATGIDPSRLRIPDDIRDLPWEEAIFERRVTGSSEGTGFGLHIVRSLMSLVGGDGRGSIHLVEYRNRVVFALELPAAD